MRYVAVPFLLPGVQPVDAPVESAAHQPPVGQRSQTEELAPLDPRHQVPHVRILPVPVHEKSVGRGGVKATGSGLEIIDGGVVAAAFFGTGQHC